LQPGKEYPGRLLFNCDPDNPSGDLVSEANIEVVAMPAAVQSKLNKAVNSVEKANIYAEAGLWYNALDEALKLAQASKLGEVGSTLLNDLAQCRKHQKPLQNCRQKNGTRSRETN
jgi:hypothetical protein